ncbi:hypothetical protein J8I29_09725 [Labrys sp. LIt4]|uniref:hypothetical protein n=1 Tax=Labrys sp. LIt4 TaxID=2821355 RepID=UPI001AE0323B|nr:hypothetical protein [Labrys sp. LIt4]MBP0579585.1 hypothetical protein [Labrys sp. LIt4]
MALATKQRDRPHARLYAEWLHLPAWDALSPEAITLLVTLMARFRPFDGNCIALSDRQAAALAHCSRPTAVKAIASLVELGWLEIEAIGSFRGARDKRVSRYSLTCQPRYAGEPAKMTFLHWRPLASGQKENRKRPQSVPPRAKEQTNDSKLHTTTLDAQIVDIASTSSSSGRPVH